MASIILVPTYSCTGLIAGKNLAHCMISPRQPVNEARRLQVKSLASGFFSKLAQKRFESLNSFTIRNAGSELVEYALSGAPVFEIEAGALDTIAHVYIQAEHADVQVIAGGMPEGAVRKLLMSGDPTYQFSTPIKAGGQVQCGEELCVTLLTGEQLGQPEGAWLVLCDLNHYLEDVASMELAMPEVVSLFAQLTAEVTELLE